MSPSDETNAGGWTVWEREDDTGRLIRNLVPDEDTLEHRAGLDCPCRPVMTRDTRELALIAHNAYDGRESFEERYPAGRRGWSSKRRGD